MPDWTRRQRACLHFACIAGGAQLLATGCTVVVLHSPPPPPVIADLAQSNPPSNWCVHACIELAGLRRHEADVLVDLVLTGRSLEVLTDRADLISWHLILGDPAEFIEIVRPDGSPLALLPLLRPDSDEERDRLHAHAQDWTPDAPDRHPMLTFLRGPLIALRDDPGFVQVVVTIPFGAEQPLEPGVYSCRLLGRNMIFSMFDTSMDGPLVVVRDRRSLVVK